MLTSWGSFVLQASGVAVTDEAVSAFEEMKIRHTNRYIVMKISDDKTKIEIEKTLPIGDGDASIDTYNAFVGDCLPEREGRYAVYDFEYTTTEGGKRNKLLFIVWAPDEAPIKEKMLYASSKDALKKKLNGIHFEVQGTDLDEVEYDTIFQKYTGGGMYPRFFLASLSRPFFCRQLWMLYRGLLSA